MSAMQVRKCSLLLIKEYVNSVEGLPWCSIFSKGKHFYVETTVSASKSLKELK